MGRGTGMALSLTLFLQVLWSGARAAPRLRDFTKFENLVFFFIEFGRQLRGLLGHDNAGCARWQ